MNELISLLVGQLGVDEGQAKGGAGLLFKLAQEKLGDLDFQKVKDAVPDVDDLISAAPEGGSVGGLLGGLASSLGGGDLGNLAELAGGFKSLNLDADMIAKFLPIVLSFVQGKGGDSLKTLLGDARGGCCPVH